MIITFRIAATTPVIPTAHIKPLWEFYSASMYMYTYNVKRAKHIFSEIYILNGCISRNEKIDVSGLCFGSEDRMNGNATIEALDVSMDAKTICHPRERSELD
jgi:hypothetical protein